VGAFFVSEKPKHPLRVVSPAQSAANASNALHSQGPSTPEGKAIAARNATKHGLRAETVIVPGLEPREDWEAHHAGIVATLQPVGYLECELASRVALLTWRLRRVARHEAEQIAIRRARAQRRALRTFPQGVQQLATYTAEVKLALQAVMERGGATPLPEASARLILRALKSAGAEQVPAVGKDPWTIDQLMLVCVRLCDENAERSSELWNATAQELVKELMRLEPAHVAVSTFQLATLPSPNTLDRIQRAEAHLERCLRRTLVELRALQEHRALSAALPYEKLPNEPKSAAESSDKRGFF
jgi:hypothetical protein